MPKIPLFVWLSLTLAALGPLAGSARASVVQALNLDELVSESDRILVGRVLFAESFQDGDGRILTWYRLEVERELGKAQLEPEAEVIVQVLGGAVGDLGMRVEGEPRFQIGERAVVFVRAGGPVAFRPVGMAQGVMRIRNDVDGESVVQSREGLLLMKRGADGLLRPSPGALPRRERLDTFLGKVRRIVKEQAGSESGAANE